LVCARSWVMKTCFVFILPCVARLCVAQAVTSGTSTIVAIVHEAQKGYPSVRVSQDEMNAAAARLALARTAYLPRIDGVAQINRGTRNNVFGSLLPQQVIPSMSGPVIGTNNGGSVWGSAAGLLLTWQPFDFGLRHANVQANEAGRERAAAASERTELEVAAASADAYLTGLAALATREAASVAVQNWETLRTSIHALVTASLRPGADESRVDAERAAALSQVALAQEAVESSAATLKKFAPTAGDLGPSQGRFGQALPEAGTSEMPLVPAGNPAVAEQEAAVKQSAAQLKSATRSWVPQFNLEGAAYARGTGAELNGGRLAGANGLAPNVGNYAAGLNITFPFMDFAATHAREAEQSAMLEAARANRDLTLRSLAEQFAQAQAQLRSAQAIAANTPVESKAAQTALDQAIARYKAGLAPIDDVAQAQRLLAQARTDDSVARLNVWRAFLRLQYVRGDLQPFLDEASRP
jgi:outer membrane protein